MNADADPCRLFVAAELDGPARAACASAAFRLRMAGYRGRWSHPEAYHLTLAFLGDVDAIRVPALAEAVARAARGVAPFDVTLAAVGCFHDPCVAWIGPADGSPEFVSAANAVRLALAGEGFSFDRPPSAHVTIAAGLALAPLPAIAPPAASTRVRSVGLFRTRRSTAGTRYERLADAPLLAVAASA